MFKYLKYYITPIISPVIIAGLLLGGNYMWFGFIFLLIIFLLGDAIFSEDLDESHYSFPYIIEFPLFLSLPILIVLLISFAWVSGLGDFDLFGIGEKLSFYLNYDFINKFNSQFICWVNPIAPLQQTEEIKKAMNLFKYKKIDSLFSIYSKKVHFLKNAKPLNFNKAIKFQQTQSLLPISEMTYSIMAWRTKTFANASSCNT